MVNEYDIKAYAKKYPEKCWYTVNDNNMIVAKNTNEIKCHISELVEMMRKKMHCDFEFIYGCHASLETTYRCKECGTVIFARDDESWDPNLCCPTCGDYKTYFKYWTSEEIASSEEKQNTIAFLEKMRADEIEANKRHEQRGKWDWQVETGKIKLFNRAIYWTLECDNLFKTKLKGLRLAVNWARRNERNDDIESYSCTKHITIPLSITAIKYWCCAMDKSKITA